MACKEVGWHITGGVPIGRLHGKKVQATRMFPMALPCSQRGEEGGAEQSLDSFSGESKARLCLTVLSLSCDLGLVSGLGFAVRRRMSLLQMPLWVHLCPVSCSV